MRDHNVVNPVPETIPIWNIPIWNDFYYTCVVILVMVHYWVYHLRQTLRHLALGKPSNN